MNNFLIDQLKMDLSKQGQQLISLLNDSDNVLYRYIQAYDYNQDDDSALRSIAERIGIFIPDGEYSPVYLFYQLESFILGKVDKDLTREIVNMSPEQYEDYLIKLDPTNKNLSREQFYPLYANRLMDLI